MSRLILAILLFLTASLLASAQSSINREKLAEELDRFELELLYLYIKDNKELSNNDQRVDYHNRVNAGFHYLDMQRKAEWTEDHKDTIKSKLKNKGIYDWKGTTEDIEKRCLALKKECDGLTDLEKLKSILQAFVLGKAGVRNSSTLDNKHFNHIEKNNPKELDRLISGIIDRVSIIESATKGTSEKVLDDVHDSPYMNNPQAQVEGEKKSNKHDSATIRSMKSKNLSSWSNHWLFKTIIGFFGGVIGFIIGYKTNRSLSSKDNRAGIQRHGKVGSHEKNSNAPKVNMPIQSQFNNKEKERLEKQVSDLEKTNKELNEENSKLKQSQSTIEGPSEPEVTSSKYDLGVVVQQKQIIYLSSPNVGGLFSRVYETSTIGNRSYFEFILTSENTANFRFIDDVSIQKRAIDTFGARISEIADETNWIEANTKGIIVEEVGKAVIEGDNWKVVQKTKIRYI